MTKFIQRRVEAAIALESSRGVGVAPLLALGKTDFSMYDKTVDARQDDSLGNITDSFDKFVVEKYAQGALEGSLGANSGAYMLALMLGAAPSTGSVTDSSYTKTYTGLTNTNQHVSASLLVKDANETRLHKLLMLNQLELNVDTEDLVRFTAEYISKRAVTSTQSIPTYVDDFKFTKRKFKVKIASTVGGLAAASRLPLKSFKLTFSKNLMRDSEIGTVEPTDILNQQISVEGEIKLNYNDQTYKNYMLNGDKKAMRVSMESENLIGATTYGSISFDLAKVDFFGWEPDGSNDDILQNVINFKANLDLTSGLLTNVTAVTKLATL